MGNERIDWLRRFLTLENGIPSHDTLGRMKFLLKTCRYCANDWVILKFLGKSISRKRMAAHMVEAPCWVMR